MLSDLLATNRRLSEEILQRVRRLDADVHAMRGERDLEGVMSTGAAPWMSAPQAVEAVETAKDESA